MVKLMIKDKLSLKKEANYELPLGLQTIVIPNVDRELFDKMEARAFNSQDDICSDADGDLSEGDEDDESKPIAQVKKVITFISDNEVEKFNTRSPHDIMAAVIT